MISIRILQRKLKAKRLNNMLKVTQQILYFIGYNDATYYKKLPNFRNVKM